MRIGITGHQELPDPTAWEWVESRLRGLLAELGGPHQGYSALAMGADQLFAGLILQGGGELHAVIPFAGYEWKFAPGQARGRYLALLQRAAGVEVLPGSVGKEQLACLRAGERVVALCEVLVAVWNGRPAAGMGGTADVVDHARAAGRRIFHLNPETRTAGWLEPAEAPPTSRSTA
jgi:hypothetical protein